MEIKKKAMNKLDTNDSFTYTIEELLKNIPSDSQVDFFKTYASIWGFQNEIERKLKSEEERNIVHKAFARLLIAFAIYGSNEINGEYVTNSIFEANGYSIDKEETNNEQDTRC